MNDIQKSKMKNKGLLVALLLFISLGYALLNANLRINGTSKINNSRWSIYFDNVVVNQNSVSLSTGDFAAAVKQNDSTEVIYTVTLNKPGDFYEFSVDAVNDGTVDAMVDSVVSTYKIGEGEVTAITANNLPSYLTYSATYSDNKPILQNHYLKANTTENYKVRIEYKKDITASDLPSTDQSIAFSFTVNYKQADDNAIEVRTQPVSFADDDWDTIISAAQDGNTSVYHVGDTKTIDMGTFGTHTLRVANNSTPAECSTEGFSQTACGFVLEFADIIKNRVMNSTSTNVGGWPASEMRTYVNGDIYNALPTTLKNAIIDTSVVSGHGSTPGETNFTSTDKLYLLSIKEVGFDVSRDSAKAKTRILDYYNANNNNNSRKKKYNNYADWWLRSAPSNHSSTFCLVYYTGDLDSYNAPFIVGVAPAFRLG